MKVLRFLQSRGALLDLASVVVLAGMCLSVALQPFPLSNDGGSHLYNAIVSHGLILGDASWTGAMQLSPTPTPNWGVPLLLMGLGGGVLAAKLVVVACLVGMFAGVRLLGRAWTNDIPWGPPALLAANSWFVWMGFWGFVLASAMGVACLAWVKTRWERPAPWIALAIGAWQLVLLAFHPMPPLFVAFVIVAMSLLDRRAEGSLMDRWPFLAGAATGILGIVLLRLRGGDAPIETFQLTLRPIVDSILTFPMDAFETVRLPHADAAYSLGIMALVVVIAAFEPGRRHVVLLCGALVLLLARVFLNDALLGGAFVAARLGFYAWLLVTIWGWSRVSGTIRAAAGIVLLASTSLGTVAGAFVGLRSTAAVSEVVEAGRRAGIRRGERLVRVRAPSPRADSAYELRRVRLPYLLTHAVDWLAAETGAQHLTNYELLGRNFVNRIHLPPGQAAALPSLVRLEETDPAGHQAELRQVLQLVAPEIVAVIGDHPSVELKEIERAGYRVVAEGGRPVFIRYLRRGFAASTDSLFPGPP